MHEPVTFVNAPLLASERGISVEETKSASSIDYLNLIQVSAMAKGETVTVAGVLVGKRDTERLVRVYDHNVDMVFAPIMVVFRYEDRPGVIGTVGTLLGEAGINIANMQVGRHAEGAEAIMVLAVDSPIPQGVLDQVVKRVSMRDARLVVNTG
jgi:D-3-phosphoglycerate dehydrogenase